MSQRSQILIVDDDPSVTASIGLMLKQAGLGTHACDNPAAALAALDAARPALVIQDMNFTHKAMSGDEGAALFRSIRALDPALPVILMTAWSSVENSSNPSISMPSSCS